MPVRKKRKLESTSPAKQEKNEASLKDTLWRAFEHPAWQKEKPLHDWIGLSVTNGEVVSLHGSANICCHSVESIPPSLLNLFVRFDALRIEREVRIWPPQLQAAMLTLTRNVGSTTPLPPDPPDDAVTIRLDLARLPSTLESFWTDGDSTFPCDRWSGSRHALMNQLPPLLESLVLHQFSFVDEVASDPSFEHCLGNLPAKLKDLDLADAKLEVQNLYLGPFPKTLQRVNLEGNGLSGTPRILKSFTNRGLTSLNLSKNCLEGSVGELIPHLPKSLLRLSLAQNRFEGTFPFANLPCALTHLNLSHNRFEGAVWLAEAPETLSKLDLSHNSFSGTLNLCETSPRTLALEFNNFIGPLDLRHVWYSGDHFTRGNSFSHALGDDHTTQAATRLNNGSIVQLLAAAAFPDITRFDIK